MLNGYAALAVQVAVLASLVLVLRVLQSRGYRLRLVCPKGRGVVEAALLRSKPEGPWEGVTRCTGFLDPQDVRCDRSCVKLLNAGQPR